MRLPFRRKQPQQSPRPDPFDGARFYVEPKAEKSLTELRADYKAMIKLREVKLDQRMRSLLPDAEVGISTGTFLYNERSDVISGRWNIAHNGKVLLVDLWERQDLFQHAGATIRSKEELALAFEVYGKAVG